MTPPSALAAAHEAVELLPCPFCGGKVIHRIGIEREFAACVDRCVEMSALIGELALKWNQREPALRQSLLDSEREGAAVKARNEMLVDALTRSRRRAHDGKCGWFNIDGSDCDCGFNTDNACIDAALCADRTEPR